MHLVDHGVMAPKPKLKSRMLIRGKSLFRRTFSNSLEIAGNSKIGRYDEICSDGLSSFFSIISEAVWNVLQAEVCIK